MTLLEGADYFIRVVDLPPRCGGLVSPNPDGTFNVYLDAKQSKEEQIDAYIHEFLHMDNDDFYNGKPICEVEDQ